MKPTDFSTDALVENKAQDAALAASPGNDLIQEGDVVLLWFERTSYLVQAVAKRTVSIHCGRPLSCDDWFGRPFGQKVICEHGHGYLLRPTMDDLMMKASRESGVIYPKDAAFLMIKAGVKPGAKVLEIGTGSGALTMALAQAVGPEGRIWTFDRRADLPKNARKNISRAGLEGRVEFCQRIAGEPIPESGFDVAILDIPTPWEEVGVVRDALKGSGRVVSLNPTFNQIERMAEALRASGFILVESVELLERPILAREGRTRPVQRMVSHTEFMLFGTKVILL